MIRAFLTRYPAARMPFRGLNMQHRCFGTPNSRLRGELVQDLYLKELRAYKPTPIKLSDSQSHVQKFSAPKAPHSPDEGDIAQDLKAYEDQQVELEGQTTPGEAAAPEESWFEEEDWDEDGEKAAGSH